MDNVRPIKFYTSPLYIGELDFNNPILEIGRKRNTKLGDISLEEALGSQDLTDDLTDVLSGFHSSQEIYEIKNGGQVLATITARVIHRRHAVEDKIGVVESPYHRVLRIEYCGKIPAPLREALQERGYKEIPLSHVLVRQSGLLEE